MCRSGVDRSRSGVPTCRVLRTSPSSPAGSAEAAHQRYFADVATIQIRDVPEDAFETLRQRARLEGRSIQAYMQERVVEMAPAPTKAEHLAAIEDALGRRGGADVTAEEIVADVAAERR